MHLSGLDLNLLVVLDALFTEKSVTRTGERIHLSQSATSAALARLRECLGDELLVHVGHKMVLTPRAQSLVEPVRDLLLRADAIAKHKTAFEPATAVRRFRLMMSDYPATVLMPQALARIQAVAPGLSFEILSIPDQPEQYLERGEVDLLIMPQQWASRLHPSEELFRDQYIWVIWSGNKLVKDGISLDQYLNLGHVGVQFAGRPFPVLEEWFFEQFGHKRRIEIVATTFNLMAHLVTGTARVATMHRRLARQCAKWLPIRLITPSIEMPAIVERLQWHTYRESDLGILWLRKMLRDAALEVCGTEMTGGIHDINSLHENKRYKK
jgi:LysR family transcriptional regulator, nod-box dependent transcriptional activator